MKFISFLKSTGQRIRNVIKNKKVSLLFLAVQFFASIFFIYHLFSLRMLPERFLLLLVIILLGAMLILILSERLSGKKKIPGRVLCIIISGVLLLGGGYVSKAIGTVISITNNSETKIDNMVVAVLHDDSADTLEDIAKDDFGVQYDLKGDEILKTVEGIEQELGQKISTIEYDNITDQIKGLDDGEVRAVILNEAYIELLEEFSNTGMKIIYTRDVEAKIENKEGKQEVKTEEEPFVIYISGIDTYGSIKKTSRSDVNILAVVNPSSHQVLLITTPRDYYIKLPGITGMKKDKLTHAGIYGVDISMAALGALYDVEPDFYVRINFTSFEKIVDALGGIDIDSEYAFTTSGEECTVVKGRNHFNGMEALAFCRERYNLPGGDFQRGRNQQAMLTAMIQKVISPSILTGAGDIMESISGNVDTDMSAEQIQSLIKSQLEDPQPWDVISMDARGTGDRQVCYSIPEMSVYVTQPDQDSVDEIKTAISQVWVGETPKEQTEEDPAKKEEIPETPRWDFCGKYKNTNERIQ